MFKTRSESTRNIGIGSLHISFIVLSMVLALFGPLTRSAAAQTMMGDFTGVVTDPSGNALQGAQVSIINDDTHGTRTATTDNTGTYRANGFQPGMYTFDITASGFKEYVQTGVMLTTAGVKPVNVQLSVGAVTQEVKITGQTPVISTESQTITLTPPSVYLDKPTVMDSETNGIYQNWLTWLPGNSVNGDYQFGGTRPAFQQNNLAGIENEELFMHTNIDAIGSVSVVEMAPAEYARPVVTDASIKSGTNSLHATAFWDYYNHNCLDALQTPFSGGHNTRGPCSSEWRPYYGVGGPVYIPHVYDGRNKSFFYFGLKRNSPATLSGSASASVPTLAMQAGNFSNYPKIITDPTTGLPFPGNVIPANRISSVAATIINDEIGNHYTYVGSPDSFVNNVQALGILSVPVTMWDVRIDENMGSRDILTGIWINQQKEDTLQTNTEHSPQTLGGTVSAGNAIQTGKLLSIAETHVFSANIVNELRIGFARSFYGGTTTLDDFSTPIYGDTTMNAWGLQGITNSPHLQGQPVITIDNWLSGGGTQSFEWDTRPLGYDNITFIKGKHTYKAGISATKLMDDGPGAVVPGTNGPYWGQYEFTGQFTGEPFADFLLGVPGPFSRFTPRPLIDRRMWEFGAFVQDDFRVTRKLTVSYGLRWNKFTIPYDKNGLYYNFDPSTNQIVVPGTKALAGVSPAWPLATFPVVLASADKYPAKLTNGSYALMPRLGFSYRLNNKTVLRGGWGLYNASVRFNGLHVGGPFALTESFINTPDTASPTGTQYAWPDPFPSAAPVATVLTASGTSKNYKDPYSLNSQISLERELMPNWGFRATWLGTLGRQLIWTQNVNSAVISTTPYTQASNPNPNLQTLNLTQNGARSIYNGITLTLEHPWETGLWTSISYTRAWNRTDAQGATLAVDDLNSYTPEYAYNLKRDWGNDTVDVPNDFIINSVADVPVGKGKRFASNANWLVNGVLGNWSVTTTFNFDSGSWFNPVESGIDPGNLGNFSSRRINQIPGCNPYAGAHNKYGLWFNPACYTPPPNGQLGNTPKDGLLGPAGWMLEMNPFKEFPLAFREGARLRVGAQLWDTLNHPQYNTPVTDLSNPEVGQIVSLTARAISFKRQVMISGKIIF